MYACNLLMSSYMVHVLDKEVITFEMGSNSAKTRGLGNFWASTSMKFLVHSPCHDQGHTEYWRKVRANRKSTMNGCRFKNEQDVMWMCSSSYQKFVTRPPVDYSSTFTSTRYTNISSPDPWSIAHSCHYSSSRLMCHSLGTDDSFCSCLVSKVGLASLYSCSLEIMASWAHSILL